MKLFIMGLLVTVKIWKPPKWLSIWHWLNKNYGKSWMEYNESMKSNDVAFHVLMCKISMIYLEGYSKTNNTDWLQRGSGGIMFRRGRKNFHQIFFYTSWLLNHVTVKPINTFFIFKNICLVFKINLFF